LRAPAFFENLFYFLSPMRERGVLSSPIAPEAQFDTASTRDVADVALRLLTHLNFRGKSAIELHGQPGLSMGKIANIIGEVLGRGFPAERIRRDADIERMVAAGMGRDFANLMNDAWEAFSKGPLREKEPAETSRMQSAIENFIREQLTPAIVAPARLRSPAATSKMEPVH
jgi:nucleoside-diphosphate-sugar epimerase